MKKIGADGALGGFTIIEVILVLAIAALIFLMVFIALPTLQRSQRDTQRRQDMARLADQVTQFQTNNNGKLPGDGKKDPEADVEKLADLCPTPSAVNNSASSPANAECFIKNYMNGVNSVENEFTDPDGWAYGLYISSAKNGGWKGISAADGGGEEGSLFNHVIYLVKNAKCSDENVVESANSRDYAITYKLEGNGTFCSDNGS